jgi:hypothetical protein
MSGAGVRSRVAIAKISKLTPGELRVPLGIVQLASVPETAAALGLLVPLVRSAHGGIVLTDAYIPAARQATAHLYPIVYPIELLLMAHFDRPPSGSLRSIGGPGGVHFVGALAQTCLEFHYNPWW